MKEKAIKVTVLSFFVYMDNDKMVRIYLDVKEMNNVLDKIDDLDETVVNNVATNLQANLKMESPVDEGKLQGSWTIFNDGPLEKTVRTAANYAEYVNDGTGLDGPLHRKITPKTKKALKFKPSKGPFKGKTVFAKSVKGIKPRRFVEKSMERTERRIPELVIQSINQLKLG